MCIPRNPVTPVNRTVVISNCLTWFVILHDDRFAKFGFMSDDDWLLSMNFASSFMFGLLYMSCISMLYLSSAVYTFVRSSESIPRSSMKSSFIDIVSIATNFFMTLYMSFSVLVLGCSTRFFDSDIYSSAIFFSFLRSIFPDELRGNSGISMIFFGFI